MANILKKLREAAELTQEAVADKLNVTVNTIQNWERTGKIAKESLHELLDLYHVDQTKRNLVVLSIFGNSGTEDTEEMAEAKKAGTDNFPYFLFGGRQDIIAAARKAVLSPEEMDLFGYSYYMGGINDANEAAGQDRKPMDFSFFEKNGGYFSTMEKIGLIKAKLGEYTSPDNSFGQTVGAREPSLAWLAYNFGLQNPGKPFQYCHLNKEAIANTIDDLPDLKGAREDIGALYAYCKYAEPSVALGTDSMIFKKNEYEKYDEVNHKKNTLGAIVEDPFSHSSGKPEYRLRLEGIKSLCFTIASREPEEAESTYYLELTKLGREYIKWYEG